MHCSVLNCTALHCAALLCIALRSLILFLSRGLVSCVIRTERHFNIAGDWEVSSEMCHFGLAVQEGRWEFYIKYIEQNCFSYCLSMQCTNMSHLAVVAWSDWQEVMAAKLPLLVPWMLIK